MVVIFTTCMGIILELMVSSPVFVIVRELALSEKSATAAATKEDYAAACENKDDYYSSDSDANFCTETEGTFGDRGMKGGCRGVCDVC
jgi:hypothetical protein